MKINVFCLRLEHRKKGQWLQKRFCQKQYKGGRRTKIYQIIQQTQIRIRQYEPATSLYQVLAFYIFTLKYYQTENPITQYYRVS